MVSSTLHPTDVYPPPEGTGIKPNTNHDSSFKPTESQSTTLVDNSTSVGSRSAEDETIGITHKNHVTFAIGKTTHHEKTITQTQHNHSGHTNSHSHSLSHDKTPNSSNSHHHSSPSKSHHGPGSNHGSNHSQGHSQGPGQGRTSLTSLSQGPPYNTLSPHSLAAQLVAPPPPPQIDHHMTTGDVRTRAQRMWDKIRKNLKRLPMLFPNVPVSIDRHIIEDIIAHNDFFAQFPESTRLYLQSRMVACKKKRGQIIYKKGEYGADCFVLVKGTVGVYMKNRNESGEENNHNESGNNDSSKNNSNQKNNNNNRRQTLLSPTPEKCKRDSNITAQNLDDGVKKELFGDKVQVTSSSNSQQDGNTSTGIKLDKKQNAALLGALGFLSEMQEINKRFTNYGKRVTKLGEGSIFGEAALIQTPGSDSNSYDDSEFEHRRTATTICETDVELLILNKSDFTDCQCNDIAGRIQGMMDFLYKRLPMLVPNAKNKENNNSIPSDELQLLFQQKSYVRGRVLPCKMAIVLKGECSLTFLDHGEITSRNGPGLKTMNQQTLSSSNSNRNLSKMNKTHTSSHSSTIAKNNYNTLTSFKSNINNQGGPVPGKKLSRITIAKIGEGLILHGGYALFGSGEVQKKEHMMILESCGTWEVTANSAKVEVLHLTREEDLVNRLPQQALAQLRKTYLQMSKLYVERLASIRNFHTSKMGSLNSLIGVNAITGLSNNLASVSSTNFNKSSSSASSKHSQSSFEQSADNWYAPSTMWSSSTSSIIHKKNNYGGPGQKTQVLLKSGKFNTGSVSTTVAKQSTSYQSQSVSSEPAISAIDEDDGDDSAVTSDGPGPDPLCHTYGGVDSNFQKDPLYGGNSIGSFHGSIDSTQSSRRPSFVGHNDDNGSTMSVHLNGAGSLGRHSLRLPPMQNTSISSNLSRRHSIDSNKTQTNLNPASVTYSSGFNKSNSKYVNHNDIINDRDVDFLTKMKNMNNFNNSANNSSKVQTLAAFASGLHSAGTTTPNHLGRSSLSNLASESNSVAQFLGKSSDNVKLNFGSGHYSSYGPGGDGGAKDESLSNTSFDFNNNSSSNLRNITRRATMTLPRINPAWVRGGSLKSIERRYSAMASIKQFSENNK